LFVINTSTPSSSIPSSPSSSSSGSQWIRTVETDAVNGVEVSTASPVRVPDNRDEPAVDGDVVAKGCRRGVVGDRRRRRRNLDPSVDRGGGREAGCVG
jgi:hypothetical protein